MTIYIANYISEDETLWLGYIKDKKLIWSGWEKNINLAYNALINRCKIDSNVNNSRHIKTSHKEHITSYKIKTLSDFLKTYPEFFI